MMSTPVLIVGAGPTGLVAATLLARRGVASLVVDRHPGIYPLPRAVHLDDEIHRILQWVGVAGEFTAISRPALGMRLLDGGHRVLAELRRDRPVGVHGYPQANLFDQPDLEKLLRANLNRQPAVTVRSGVEVVFLEDADDGVVVTLREGATLFRVRAEIVLGCDGANSTVRDLIGSMWQDLRFTERWCVVDGRCATDLDAWDGVHQVCDPRRAATYMRIGPDRYRWEFRLTDDETPQSLDLDRLLAPWTRGTPVEVLRSVEYTFKARLADRWQRGRVFLLGDAAHLTPPFIGQGLGAGLRDAANLAWKIAAVVNDNADERLLATYELERRPQARVLIRAALAVGWAMTGGQDAAAAVRRAVLAAACRVPGFSTAALATIAPRIRRGPLVGAGHGLAGTLVPQPWVTVRGRRQRLDDVLGDGFVVLGRGVPDRASRALAHRLGARLVRSGDPTIAAWLRRGHARTVLIRPDRVVLAAGRTGADLTAAARPALALLAGPSSPKPSSPGPPVEPGLSVEPGPPAEPGLSVEPGPSLEERVSNPGKPGAGRRE